MFFLIMGCVVPAPLVSDEWPFTQVAFEVASAQSGVGPSVGITGNELPVAGKLTLIFLMRAGRLELTAVLALATLPISRLILTSQEVRQ